MMRTLILMHVVMVLGCGSSSAETGANESGMSESSTGPSGGSSTGSSTDAPTGGAEAATAGEETTSGTSEAVETGAVTTEGSSEWTSSSESSSGSSSGGEESTSETTEVSPDGLLLDPDTLEVFWLPINSVRYGVGGLDAATNTCVTVIFWGDDPAEVCEPDAMPQDPYVVITPNSGLPCDQWDYDANVEVVSASGCRQVTSLDPTVAIDMVLEVSGEAYSGKITVKSP